MVYKNITNTASFRSTTNDFEGSDDVIVQMESEDYTFEKTAAPENWTGEGQLTYTITLTKLSGDDLSDITVTDVLPEDVVFDPNTVEIDGIATTTNFDASDLPTVVFGTETPLTVTDIKPLVIIFRVTKA